MLSPSPLPAKHFHRKIFWWDFVFQDLVIYQGKLMRSHKRKTCRTRMVSHLYKTKHGAVFSYDSVISIFQDPKLASETPVVFLMAEITDKDLIVHKNDVTSICFAVVRWSQCRHLLKFKNQRKSTASTDTCPLAPWDASLWPQVQAKDHQIKKIVQELHRRYSTHRTKNDGLVGSDVEWLAEKKSSNLMDPKLLASSNFESSESMWSSILRINIIHQITIGKKTGSIIPGSILQVAKTCQDMPRHRPRTNAPIAPSGTVGWNKHWQCTSQSSAWPGHLKWFCLL